MVENMLVNGKMVNKMEKEYFICKVIKGSLVNGKMGKGRNG
jgi:hypothetical protein